MGKGPVSCQSCGHENPAGQVLQRLRRAPGGADDRSRAARLHAAAPRREDPRFPERARGRAQAGHRPLRRRRALDGARRARRSRGVASPPRSLLPDPRRTASTATRGRSTSTPATASWRSSAPRSPTRTTPSAPAAAALDLARELGALAEDVRRERGLEFAVRMGLNSGEVVVGRDRRRPAHGLHRAGPRRRARRPRAAAGAAGRHQRDRADRAARVGFLRPPRPWGAEPQGRERSRARVRAAGSGPIRSRLERSRARGFSRFVGRERELALLERALREAQSGRPTVVLVTGEPGAGKSRLCHELVERSRGVAAPLCPRALPRTHAPLSRHRRAGARPLRRRRRRVGARTSETPCGAVSASAPPVDPIALAFWLELLGVPDHVAGPFGAGARSAPHASVPVTSAI